VAVVSAALAFAGLRALADCGTLIAYGMPDAKPAHLEAAKRAGWASAVYVYEHGKKRFKFVYRLSIDRSRAIRMLTPATERVAA
jgi:hypothetical protein